MPLVLVGVFEQNAVKLMDMVFGQRDVGERFEDQFHHVGVAGNFLFVAGPKGLRSGARKKPLDYLVGQCDAFDSR